MRNFLERHDLDLGDMLFIACMITVVGGVLLLAARDMLAAW